MTIPRAEIFRKGTKEVRNFAFVAIDQGELPESIFAGCMRGFSRDEVTSAAVVQHEGGVRTYRAVVNRMRGDKPEQIVFFVDVLGAEEIGYVRTDHGEEISFARNTHTADGFGQRGLGAQRLVMANQFTAAEHGRPLNSGRSTLPEGRRLWKSLVREGLVEATGNLVDHMYRFKMPGGGGTAA